MKKIISTAVCLIVLFAAGNLHASPCNVKIYIHASHDSVGTSALTSFIQRKFERDVRKFTNFQVVRILESSDVQLRASAWLQGFGNSSRAVREVLYRNSTVLFEGKFEGSHKPEFDMTFIAKRQYSRRIKEAVKALPSCQEVESIISL